MLNDLVIASDTASLSFRSDGKLIGLIDVKILFFFSSLVIRDVWKRWKTRGWNYGSFFIVSLSDDYYFSEEVIDWVCSVKMWKGANWQDENNKHRPTNKPKTRKYTITNNTITINQYVSWESNKETSCKIAELLWWQEVRWIMGNAVLKVQCVRLSSLSVLGYRRNIKESPSSPVDVKGSWKHNDYWFQAMIH